MRIVLAAGWIALVGLLIESQANGDERIELDNGITVILMPVDGTDRVAVESFYGVGFIHEPQGMTQAAHLLEHLVCYGATDSYQQKEAMKRFNDLGMANAETLPDCTHYDYVLPADQLELAIKVERERLTSLSFDEGLIKAEAKRCYQETDFVETNRASGMSKHAMMAFSQAWRFGAKEALVRGGLEEITVDALRDFHRQAYCPQNLTLVIVGGFQSEQAKDVIKEHLGGVAPANKVSGVEIEWAKVPRHHTVHWDAKVRGVCLAFPPPKDRVAVAAMTLFGSLLMQPLYIDAELKESTQATLCTNVGWKAGPLPFFVYAAAKEGQSLQQVEQVLRDRFFAAIEKAKLSSRQLTQLARQLQLQTGMFNRAMLDQQTQMLQRMRPFEKERAEGMVLGQTAINAAMMEMLLGPKREQAITEIEAMVGPTLEKLIDQTLDKEKMIVTYVSPKP